MARHVDPDYLSLFADSGRAAGAKGPQYLGLRDHIAELIRSGKLRPQEKLPSERQLLSILTIARGTLREALAQLEGEGLIYRLDRRGWFVSPERIEYNPTKAEGFMEFVAAQGRTPTTITLSKESVPARGRAAEVLGIGDGDQMYLIQRKRLIDERPVVVEQICVNPALFPDLLDQDLDRSLTGVLESHYGVSVANSDLEMYPSALTGWIAQELNVGTGTPGLFVRRVSRDRLGRVVEFDREFWHHGAIKLKLAVNGPRRRRKA